MVKEYIPKQSDIVYVQLNPTIGHEQAGYRPCLIISNYYFNKYTHMVIACPISSNNKFFPTHYNLETTKKIKGSVFCEHIRALDYHERKLKFVEQLDEKEFIMIKELLESALDE